MVMSSDEANLALYISSSDSVTAKSNSESSIDRPVLAICDNKHRSSMTRTNTTQKDIDSISTKPRTTDGSYPPTAVEIDHELTFCETGRRSGARRAGRQQPH